MAIFMSSQTDPKIVAIETARLSLRSTHEDCPALPPVAPEFADPRGAPESWEVMYKPHGIPIGKCRLRRLRHQCDMASLGGYLCESARGIGLGREAGRACLAYGFEQMCLTRIVAMTRTGNLAALRVMESIGMMYERSIRCAHGTLVLYSATRCSQLGAAQGG
jgi:RimJ/RimL family protein N-acetyltransferase